MPYDHEKAPPQLNCGQGQIFVAKIPAKEIDKMTLSKSSSSINTIEVEITATQFRLRSEKDILPRQFLYGRHLIRGFVVRFGRSMSILQKFGMQSRRVDCERTKHPG